MNSLIYVWKRSVVNTLKKLIRKPAFWVYLLILGFYAFIMYHSILEELMKRGMNRPETLVAAVSAYEVGRLNLSVSDDFCNLLQQTWVQRYPKYPFYVGSYDAIQEGFKKRFKFCFITTAICEAQGKPDDCAELTAFRAFRDGYLMETVGMDFSHIQGFDVAGAFGTYIRWKSAVTIGLYPDLPEEKVACVGNSSLEGAKALLLDWERLAEIRSILEKMDYIQYGAIPDFVDSMSAARAIPHLDTARYPSVMKWKAQRRNRK